MELRHLRYFIVVAEQLHFSRAAEILHIAQPPLSQQIQNLEQELGVPLFLRTRRSVQLTPAGKAFLVEARKVLAQAERAIEAAHQAHKGIVGRLEIGLVSSAVTEALPNVLKRFRTRFSLVEVQLHSMATSEQVQALREGQIDVGLLHPPVIDASLELEIIRREPLVVILPDSHALANQASIELSQLSAEPFIMYLRAWNPGTFDQVTSLCRDAGFSMRLGQQATGMQSIASLVAAGFGVSLVASSLQLLQSAGVVYRPLQGVTPTIDLAVAWRADNTAPTLLNFLEVARETALEIV
jgi:DNA-binding transcriptional LysR family regulator